MDREITANFQMKLPHEGLGVRDANHEKAKGKKGGQRNRPTADAVVWRASIILRTNQGLRKAGRSPSRAQLNSDGIVCT